ncbi:peptidase S8/S53 domain-containing protein [Lactarius psammicola]|nr:peptidase S8/S53 domain-containing protein [Lactarius psammicola]
MRYSCVFVLSTLSAGLLGSLAKPLSPPWDDIHTKHSWNAVPKSWESLGHPPSDTTINIYIALKPRHENALIDALYKVTELVAPHPETLELVNSWLEYHGVHSSSVSITHGGNTLMLKSVLVTQANALLGASYQLYRQVERGETIIRTIGYALPAVLHRHVLTVVPTTSFVPPPTQGKKPRNRSGGAAGGLVKSESGEPIMMPSSREILNYLTPSILRWLYDTDTYTPTATDRNALGVVGILGDYPNLADLMAFMLKYRSDAADATFHVVQVNGGEYNPNHPSEDPEANIDIQYAEAMAYPTPHTFYSIGRQAPAAAGTNDWFVPWLEYILDQPSIPQTISISYNLEEIFLTEEYAIYVCNLFAQLGSRGVSVLVSSGNEGVGEGDCVDDDGYFRFMPNFPATCPHVTAVGGTTGYEPEEAARFSGGGFSDYFERPKYQQQAVPAYLQHLGSQYQGFYNASGRGIPDMAAQAIGFQIFFNGNEQEERGTSGATPVVAGIISLLNDWLISRGRHPLGLLNPWLYSGGFLALNDVTRGSNPGCGTPGFSATTEWDPVTGLGTPNFGKMLEVLRLEGIIGFRRERGPEDHMRS